MAYQVDLDRSEVDDLSSAPASPPPVVEKMDISDDSPELATDLEAMRAKLLPPLEDEIEILHDEAFTWEIDDWRQLEERAHSVSHNVGGYDWSILLFPEGNRSDNVSVYLEAGPLGSQGSQGAPAEPDSNAGTDGESDGAVPTAAQATDDDWYACAQFGLIMWNPEHPEIFHSSHAHHRFNADESDWGFTKFYDLRRLFSKHQGFDHALIENNKVRVTALVRVVKDPTGVLWHNFIKYDSKKETGYVGLKNQGATCYLNSLLQSLYFTKAFRRIVYLIPTENERLETVPAALQREFYLLSSSENPVGTSTLTKSFGWDSGDAFTQHDVQELNRVLMDKLEQHMKGTAVDGALNNIFVAQMKSYIKCVNVDFESSRTEDYWDIQLNVKGIRTLEDSFKNYIQVEMLEGENQYQATGHGLQDAKKGVVFQSFPPVLHLQLQRYEYDFARDIMIKINDRYEFPTSIDLSPYLEKGSDMSEPWDYELHGVLVHSGELNAGHYYALLKPTKDGHWYKFDDDKVTRATFKEVLEDNYGGDPKLPPNTPVPRGYNRFNYKRHSSAYMLVYIRKSRLDDVLPAGDDTIPSHIPEKFQQELLEEQRRQKEREEQQYFLNVTAMSSRQFSHFQGFDIGVWESKYGDHLGTANGDSAGHEDKARPDTFRLKRDTQVKEFVRLLSNNYNVDPSVISVWTLVARENKTLRLDSELSSDSSVTLETLRERIVNRMPDLRVWVELNNGVDTLTGEAKWLGGGAMSELPANGEDRRAVTAAAATRSLLFLKYFDPVAQQITGVNSHVIDDNETVGELAAKIVKFMKWPEGTQVQVSEEVKPDMIDILSPKSTFYEAEISDGDILCFERVLSAAESDAISGYKTAQEFYDFMHYRIAITFKPRSVQGNGANGANGGAVGGGGALDISNGNAGGGATTPSPEDDKAFDLWLSQKDSYTQMATKVGEHLGVPPTHLRFYTTSISGYQRTPIKNTNSSVYQILASPYVQQYSSVVLYEVLEVSLAELENKKNVSISWLSDGLSQEHKYDVLVAKSANMRDVIAILRDRANIPANSVDRIKIWTAHNGRILKLLNESSPVSTIEDQAQVYASLCPQEEFDFITSETPQDDERIIFVVHFQKDAARTHGIPFTFLVKKGEKFSDTRARLQKTLGVFDKVFEKIKFAVLQSDSYAAPTYIDDDEVDLFSVIGDNELLGLDHFDKSVRRGYGQTAILFKS